MEHFPIRQLAETDRWRLRSHFKALDIEDRRLRFGIALNDTAIDRYVDLINFDTDAVFGARDESLAFCALAHVAPVGEGAELGLSVLAAARGRGLGGALFEQAVIWARNRFLRRIHMHCLRENRAILHIAQAHGMLVSMEGGDSSAVLELPVPDAGTWVGEQAMHWRHMSDEVAQFQADWIESIWSGPSAMASALALTHAAR